MNAFRGDRSTQPANGATRRALLAGAAAATVERLLGGGPSRSLASESQPSESAAGAQNTGLVYDEAFLRHRQPEGHLERPQRLEAIVQRLRQSGLHDKLRRLADFPDPRPWIRTIHSADHVEQVEQESRRPDVCRLAVAGALAAVDAVCTGKVRNAFCALRPPGHHALNTGEYGFCFFGNAAIAARYAQQKHGLKRILVADWDYHHGNGTEWAFYDDPTVLVFSTHRLEAFPGTGLRERRGAGAGYGYNINVPLPRGAGDREILRAFEDELLPVAEPFRPELVLIAAGFDSRRDDLLGDFTVSDEGFVRLTKLLTGLARQTGRSRLVALLEGGYHLDGLAAAAEAHVGALVEAT